MIRPMVIREIYHFKRDASSLPESEIREDGGGAGNRGELTNLQNFGNFFFNRNYWKSPRPVRRRRERKKSCLSGIKDETK